MDLIKNKIMELKRWKEDLINNIKDIPKGVLQVDGKKIKNRLEPFLFD